MKIVKALSVPKIITVLCLLGLGVNGLVQVALQRDMAAKTTQLHASLAQTEKLSGQMKTGLAGLVPLQQSTEQMNSTLTALESATADMSQGLAQLSSTVSGIGDTIVNLGSSTSLSKTQVVGATQSARTLLSILKSLMSVNTNLISNLNQMANDQSAMNADLQSMNQKTQLIP